MRGDVPILGWDDVAHSSAKLDELGAQSTLTLGSEHAKGVVYTKRWVVDFILDLVGYRSNEDLARKFAVEPAAGDGAFLEPMIRRLLVSLDLHQRPLDDARAALHAYELNKDAATRTFGLATRALVEHGATLAEARDIAEGWITVGDYLLASQTDRPADLVIGNPPYIRYDDIPRKTFETYRRDLPSMVGRCDIYVGFIEAGIRQLVEGGMLGFICADRWMRAAYGVELRRLVSTLCGVEAVVEMHNAPAFEDDVAAYPAIVIIRKGPQGNALVATAGPEAGTLMNQETLAEAVADLADKKRSLVPGFTATRLDGWFDGNGAWPWLEPRRLELLRDLEMRFPPIEDRMSGTKIGIGIATGADAIYVTKDQSVVESDRLLPLAMTSDTRHGEVRWSGSYLVNPWELDGTLVELQNYPKLRAYLEDSREDLELRNIAQRNVRTWYRTIDKVRHSLLGRHKLYFPDMKLTSNPVLDRGETYPHHNLYYLVSDGWDLEVLGGLLLSRVSQLFIEAYCVKMRGGTLRFQAQYLRKIRVPDRAALPSELSDELRHAFRSRDSDAATSAAIQAYGIEEFAEDLRAD